MSHADAIVERILTREGGTSDQPNDFGGLTRFGITLGFLSDRTGHTVEPKDLLTISRAQAGEIYTAWLTATRLTDLLTIRSSETLIAERVKLVECVCDWAVQRTPVKAVKLLQELLGFHGADVDGIVGPQTIDALNAQTADAALRTAYVKARVTHRANVVKRDRTQGDFILGWVTRDMGFL